MKRIAFAISFFLAWSTWLTANVLAQAEPFYKGKTIKMIVGNPPGGGYDAWARIAARYMGKYIPGNPDFVVQNMPGAGSMVAANHVYSVAKPDGLTLGAITPSLYFEQLLGRKEVQFDWAKFTWVGSPEQLYQVLYMRSDTPYKSLEDIRKAAEPPRCGARGTGTAGHYIPKLLEEGLGLKFNVVAGYPGGGDVALAIERGEVHCHAISTSWIFGREQSRNWLKTGFIRVLVQAHSKRDPRLSDVPTIYELMEKHKTPDAIRRLTKVLLAPEELGRPILGPPGIPSDRVKILREAYNKSLEDPQLVAEAKKTGWEANPVSGDELEVIAKEVIGQPPEVIELMKKILAN
jgi:tripartite-type tricarboxylate transporter receptor subunit TctC